jgi:purine-nucleoside phosphorylase
LKLDDTKLHARTPEQAIATIRSIVDVVPSTAIVLGSGVTALNDLIDAHSFSFQEVFGVAPTVAGHAGTLTIGKLPENESVTVAVFRGRYHVYEGHDWSVVTLPTRTLVEWGVPELILTNAAGGINPTFQVGDLMVMTGFRDLISEKWRGGLIESLKKFPKECRNELSERVFLAGMRLSRIDSEFRALKNGIYAGFTGPSYETLAEIDMMRRMGCDAVAMSTVPELLTAAESNLKAAAISVITNVWNDQTVIGGHEEVLEASKAASRRLDKLFRYLVSGRK